MFIYVKSQYLKNVRFPTLFHKFSTHLIKILIRFLVELDKLKLKHICLDMWYL